MVVVPGWCNGSSAATSKWIDIATLLCSIKSYDRALSDCVSTLICLYIENTRASGHLFNVIFFRILWKIEHLSHFQ